LHGADLLSRAEDLLDRQSGSFHRAANSVRPVSEKPPEMDISNPMLPFADFDKEVTTYQADAQHNLEVYGVYDGASEYNETNMPEEYSTINHAGGDISVTAGDTRPGGSTGDFIEVADYEPPQGGDEFGPSGEPHNPGSAPIGGPPVTEPAPAPRQPGQTSPNDFVPPPANPPGFPPPSTIQPTPSGPTPGGLVAGLPVGGFPGSGPGTGTGGPGARGGGTYNPGGSPGTGGRSTPGPNARGGVPGVGPGVGALAAEEAAARRAASAAAAARGGGPGAMGGAPVGAGRGKGDEDEEHQRKVLIEIDPESVFGADVLTAPQVIGDDAYEDD
jgi:hypothetical protein